MQHRARFIVFGTLALSMLLFAAPALARAGSNCTSAQVAEPFVLPDGTEYEAGALKLCVEARHSPLGHLHKTYVDGMVVGVHIGRTNSSEGPATAGSYVMFGRDAQGRLHLLGYARPGTEHMQVFSLRHANHSTAKRHLADRVREEPIFMAVLTR